MLSRTVEALEDRRLMSAGGYEVVQLTSSTSAAGVYGMDISPGGQVLGTGGQKNATLWDKGKKGKLVQTPLAGGVGKAYAAAINGSNLVVGNTGYGKGGDVHPTAWVYTKGVGYVAKDLGVLQKGGYGGALGVSDAGQIVGYSYAKGGAGDPSAFVATVRKGKVAMTDLNAYAPKGKGGFRVFAAWDANASGQIAAIGGQPGDASGRSDAVLMKVAKKGSYAVKLPSLGWSARAEGINERGQLVGYADADASGATRAVLWNTGKKGNTIKDLGTLGGANSAAVDVNNAGQVVGWSERAGGDHQSYAFLWNPGKNGNGTMIDLNTLLPKGSPLTLMFANGINDAGEIVCHAEDANHADHTVLIRPAGAKQGGAVVAPAGAGAVPAVFSGVKIEEEAGVWA